MKFSAPLLKGRLVKRYKRFLADVMLADGTIVTASCPNTGAMLGLTAPGSTVYLSVSANPARKYAYTWEMIEAGIGTSAARVLVGINTGRPNAIVSEAIAAGRIPEVAGYASLRREVKYGVASRVDLLLEDAARPPCYVEIKNVHLMRSSGLAEFPDSRTERGARHLAELSAMVAAGNRAVMVYLIQRSDAERFDVAFDIDPAYAAAAKAARAAGVEMIAYRCALSPAEIAIDRRIEINARP